ncbi:MAG: hypothetical protein JNL67_08925 [Planctomycetaceae bacterium]|nr:hypothetical protein [Planctomycetaceae bacterium]
MPTDAEIVEWVRSGSPELIDKAIVYFYTRPEFIARVKRRCKFLLKNRQMLYPDQPFYRFDAQNEVELWIFERAMSRETLPRTILERGGGFDPERGSLCDWLYEAAFYQLRDWLKQHCKPVREVALGGPEQEFAQYAEIRTTSEELELQKQLPRETQLGFREIFAEVLVGKNQRESMLSKWIDDFEILTVDDLNCIRAVRKLSDDDEQQLHLDFRSMWQTVAQRTSGKQTESADGEFDTLVGFRKAEAKVTMLFIKLQQKSNDRTYYAKQLSQIGRSEEAIKRLETEALGMKLAEIKEKYKNQWSDERAFAEAARRAHKYELQLAKAHEDLESKREFPRPQPKEIAKFLNLTANEVSVALCRAKDRLQSYLEKTPPADARVP